MCESDTALFATETAWPFLQITWKPSVTIRIAKIVIANEIEYEKVFAPGDVFSNGSPTSQ